jgi:hypothetical protein
MTDLPVTFIGMAETSSTSSNVLRSCVLYLCSRDSNQESRLRSIDAGRRRPNGEEGPRRGSITKSAENELAERRKDLTPVRVGAAAESLVPD